MDFLQSIYVIIVIATIFLITTGFFNKAYRMRFYAAAIVLLGVAYAIHYYRLSNDPGYAAEIHRSTTPKAPR